MFLELAHMLDAMQLCLSCLCKHAECYELCLWFVICLLLFVRFCFCLLSFFVFVACCGIRMFLELAHMLDAMQLCLSCLCTHAEC